MSVFLNSLMRAMKAHPHTWSWWKEVEIIRNISYGTSGHPARKLDIYRPLTTSRPSPVVLHIHGGGFSILSKESHWMAALLLARQGYTVFTINYRLAGEDPFPAAIQDTFEAASWVHDNAEQYGADNSQWFVAGESAGANLTLGLGIASSFLLDDPWAKPIFQRQLPIKGLLPACGLLQVSNPERFLANKKLSAFLKSRIMAVSRRYAQEEAHPLLDPLVLLESERATDRELPPILSFVGTKDPILDDTRRLEKALQKRKSPHLIHYYPGAVHGFHLAVWSKNAITCWNRQLDFMRQYRLDQNE